MNLKTCQSCGYNRKIVDAWRNWCFEPTVPTGVIVYTAGECEGWRRWPKHLNIPKKKVAKQAKESVFISNSDSGRGRINKRKYSLPLKNDKVREFLKKLKDS